MGEILHHYVELLTDPAHTMVEFTFVLIDVLIIDWVRRNWRRTLNLRLAQEHERLDAEHGIVHDEVKHRAPARHRAGVK